MKLALCLALLGVQAFAAETIFGVPPAGVVPHVVDGDGWKTIFTVVNLDSSAAPIPSALAARRHRHGGTSRTRGGCGASLSGAGRPEASGEWSGRRRPRSGQRGNRCVSGEREGVHVGCDLTRPRLPHRAQRRVVGEGLAEACGQRVVQLVQVRDLVPGLVEQGGGPVKVVAHDSPSRRPG